MTVLHYDFALFDITPRGLSFTFVVLENTMYKPSDYSHGLEAFDALTFERCFIFLVPLDTFFVTRGRDEFFSKAKLGIDYVFSSDPPEGFTPDVLYARLLACRHDFPGPSDISDSSNTLQSTAHLVETALQRICAS
jgi:hypothetical protein